MQFVNEYKNMGGKVTTGSDAGFIYSTPGFATIEEMELLQEAGFHPLEVIRSATMYGAQTLAQANRQGARDRRRAARACSPTCSIVDAESAREPQGALRHRLVPAQRHAPARSSRWAA